MLIKRLGLLLAVLLVMCAAPVAASSPVEVSPAAVAQAYRSYAAPHEAAGSGGKMDFVREDPSNRDAFNREVLDLMNFVRACSGAGPVSLSGEYSSLAQAGVDFLQAGGLANDHNAAAEKDERANQGLSRSNLVSGTSGFITAPRMVFGFIVDRGAGNLRNAGHRRWMLDDTRSMTGVGFTDDGNTARGAIYVNGDSNGTPGILTACPAAGVFPVEIWKTGGQDRATWSVMLGGGWSPAMRVPDGGAGVSVTVVRDDGQRLALPYTESPQENADWFCIPDSLGYGSGGGLTLNPYTFMRDGADAMAGRSYTVEITGLSGGDRTVSYTTRFDTMENILSGAGAPSPESPAPQDGSVSYSAHVENIGWMAPVSDGATAGTEGQALKMEALTVSLPQELSGSLSARAHLADIGWVDFPGADGGVIGTTGENRRMEALSLSLAGEAAQRYRIAYRTHIENIGWTDWSYDGEVSGTTGQALRCEAVQIRLVRR